MPDDNCLLARDSNGEERHDGRRCSRAEQVPPPSAVIDQYARCRPADDPSAAKETPPAIDPAPLGCHWPMRTSVSHEATTAHPAWWARRIWPFAKNTLIDTALDQLNRPSSLAEPINRIHSIVRIENRHDCRDQPGLPEQSPPARARAAESYHKERTGPGHEAGQDRPHTPGDRHHPARRGVAAAGVFRRDGPGGEPASGDVPLPAELDQGQADSRCGDHHHEVEKGDRSSFSCGHDWPRRLIAICRALVTCVSGQSGNGKRHY